MRKIEKQFGGTGDVPFDGEKYGLVPRTAKTSKPMIHVTLSADDYDYVAHWAHRNRLNMAAMVRECMDAYLLIREAMANTPGSRLFICTDECLPLEEIPIIKHYERY